MYSKIAVPPTLLWENIKYFRRIYCSFSTKKHLLITAFCPCSSIELIVNVHAYADRYRKAFSTCCTCFYSCKYLPSSIPLQKNINQEKDYKFDPSLGSYTLKYRELYRMSRRLYSFIRGCILHTFKDITKESNIIWDSYLEDFVNVIQEVGLQLKGVIGRIQTILFKEWPSVWGCYWQNANNVIHRMASC
jgi:hypothetical protein